MYLDPGFGGMLIQVIIALVATGGALLFAFRKKLSSVFKKKAKAMDNTKVLSEGESHLSFDDNVIDMLSEEP